MLNKPTQSSRATSLILDSCKKLHLSDAKLSNLIILSLFLAYYFTDSFLVFIFISFSTSKCSDHSQITIDMFFSGAIKTSCDDDGCSQRDCHLQHCGRRQDERVAKLTTSAAQT